MDNKRIDEQITNLVESIPTSKLVETAKSLFETYDLVHSLEDKMNYYQEESQLTEDSWQRLLDLFKQSKSSETFHQVCKDINLKLYCVKQFSNVKFVLTPDIEDILKFETKKYYTQLITAATAEELADTFKTLPFEFTSLMVRYLANIILKDTNKHLLPTEQEAKSYYEKVLKLKNEFIKNVNECSLGKQQTFSIVDAQLLLDCKAFFDYTPTNVGALEYMLRMFLSPKTRKKLNSMFGERRIAFMLEQALLHPSYIQFLKEIKEDTEQPYFGTDGTQNTQREQTYDDIINSVYSPEEFIPKVDDEKQQPTPAEPIQAVQPTPEELQQPEGQTPPATPAPEEEAPQ